MKAFEKSDSELIEELRKAASIWFKNTDLLLLEELIRRYGIAQARNEYFRQTPIE